MTKQRTYKAYLTGMIFMLSLVLAPSAWAMCSNPASGGGGIIYNDDENIMSYCDDTNWIAVRGSGNSGYIPNAVNMDASTNLELISGLTGISDSKTATGSLWVRTSANPAGDVGIVSFTPFKFGVLMEAPGDNIRILGANASSTTILEMETSTAINDGNWHHIMFSFDLTNGASRHLYVDGVDALAGTPSTHTDDSVDFTTQTYVGAPGNWDADIADMWLDAGTYIDLSQASNRALFYNNGPVYLGADGSLPTGSSPEAFVSGATATWHTNDGTGGGFTEIGTLTTASSFPGQSDTSLIGHWKLDETSGTTAVDSSGNGNDGTMNGGLDAGNDSVAAKINTGLDFDGTDDEIDTGDIDAMDGVNQLTISAWMRRTALNDDVAVQKGNGSDRTGINFWNDGDLYFNISDGTTAWGEITQNDTNWHHVVLVFDGTQTGNSSRLKGYLDGNELTLSYSGTIPALTATQANSFLIGHNQANGDRSEGQIDDVRIYNRVLSAAEIGELSAACEEGNMIYNDDHMVPQYCAGNDDWVAMGPVRDGIDSGLVGHWMLDETSGSSITDSSGNGNTGTWVDGADNNVTGETVDAKVDTGLIFDSTDDYINAGSDSSLDNMFAGGGTWAAWMYRNSPGENNNGRIFAKNRAGFNEGCDFATSNTNDLFFECHFSGGLQQWRTSNGSISNGEWYHVAVVYNSDSDANNAQIYMNGVPVTTNHPLSNTGTLVSDASANLILGNVTTAANRTFDGVLDDMRAYDRALSDAEIMALYELGNNNPESLDTYWKLDESSGTTAVDSSGKGIDGTLNNFSTPPGWTSAGIVGGSLLFDGTDDYIDSSVNADFSSGGYTLSAWVKTTATTDGRIFSKHTGPNNQKWLMYHGSIDRVECGLHDGAIKEAFRTGDSVNDGQWHHLACVVDNSDIQVYVDGVAGTSDAHDNTLTTNGADWQIGRINSGGEYFDGHMDEVRFYSSALSATEIDALYKMGIGHCTNPVGKEGDLIYNDDAGVDALQYCDGAKWQAVGKSP